MIPYFYLSEIPFWPMPIQTWGLMVALGILAATAFGYRESRRRGLEPAKFVDAAAWASLGGIVGARLGYLLLYRGGPLLSWEIFKIWEGGMSMLGGVLGGLAAIWLMRKRLKPFWGYAEVAALAYPLGEAIGRVGCFMIHDHQGIELNTPLSVNFSGTPRLDLGLALSMSFALLFAVFLVLRRRERQVRPLFLPSLLIGWGVIRFPLDFLRVWGTTEADFRLWLFTPAQLAAVVFVAAGVYLLVKRPAWYRLD